MTDTFEDALPRIREVLSRIAVHEADRDLRGEHPDAGVRDLADAGFGRLRVPREFGGFDVDLPTLFSLLAEAGEADSNIPQIWRGHFTATEILRRETDETARNHWLSRIGEGAVFGNAQSESADRVKQTRIHTNPAGTVVVNGTKFYSTGARFADYIRVAAVDGTRTTTFVVVDAHHSGVKHLNDWDGIGQRLTGSGSTVFTGVPVLPHGTLARERAAVRGLDSFVQVVHLANLAGIARAIVRDTVEIVRGRTRTSRHSFTDGSAAADPDVLAVIGTLEARSLTASALLETVAAALQDAHAADTEEAFAGAYVTTSAAQVAVIEAVLDAATTAFNAGGSSATRARAHLDRHWRNARTLASHNPVVYKPRVVGDHLVNHRNPENLYYEGRAAS